MAESSFSPGLSTGEPVEELRCLAQRYGLPFLAEVPDEMLDPTLVAKVPVEWSRANSLLPVRFGEHVGVLTADPAKVSQQEDLSMLIGYELRPIVAPREVIARCIERCYFRRDHSPGRFLSELAPKKEETAPVTAEVRSDDLLSAAEKTPVTQLVNLILLEAVKRRASDIHFEPFEAGLRVRYRIDGVLYEQPSPPRHLEDALVSRIKVMARMDIAEKRLPQDGMVRAHVGEREIDMRVSTVPVAEGERVVLRLLDRDAALLPLTSLGMPADTLERFEVLLRQRDGLVVVCGPTGSGKTTTLYAALGRLDATRKNILTIEDPIEYQLPNIGQIQVKPKIGLTFASGLRHILRQDPDIILVGETRDLETADIAIRASLTGHLVFTTLHTNDAPGTVVRLLDMGVEPYLLAACLRGALAQRLVRVLCRECRRTTVADAAMVKGLGAVGESLVGRQVWEPVGCGACLEGYRGRTGIFELMACEGEMQELIRSGRMAAAELRARAEQKGMRSLVAEGLNRVVEGTTSIAELLSVVAP
ncbi:MAG: ATPase, T2SS/T4P/T4SS family [Kiritimatiellae bacterium]|nr:ATPase, T2SS/T4P/T4SS family [Kiritimatiellia bacterium]